MVDMITFTFRGLQPMIFEVPVLDMTSLHGSSLEVLRHWQLVVLKVHQLFWHEVAAFVKGGK